MDLWQRLAALLPPELSVGKSADGDAEISFDGASTAVRVIHMAWVVSPEAASSMVDLQRREGRPLVVTYTRSSAAARATLREGGVSYAGEDGRIFLRAAGILIDRDDRMRIAREETEVDSDWPDAVRNPFAGRASRVARWLVLHQAEHLTQAEIARAVDVSPSLVSRTLRALEEEGFVEPSSPTESRRRITVRRARRLLDRWASTPAGRPQRQHTWDLGVTTPDAALALLVEAGPDLPMGRWAVGGVAGASTVRRVVEPADVLVWASPAAVTELEDVLMPAPGRRGRGSVRVAHVQDPWTLGLAVRREGLPVVDDVQLYLDCMREGERAYEAADAVAKEAGW